MRDNFLAQTVGFEPTVLFTVQTISSRSRYDHFDTSAYMSTHFREPNAYSVFLRTPFRTAQKNKTQKPSKLAPTKHSLRSQLHPTHNISSHSH